MEAIDAEVDKLYARQNVHWSSPALDKSYKPKLFTASYEYKRDSDGNFKGRKARFALRGDLMLPICNMTLRNSPRLWLRIQRFSLLYPFQLTGNVQSSTWICNQRTYTRFSSILRVCMFANRHAQAEHTITERPRVD